MWLLTEAEHESMLKIGWGGRRLMISRLFIVMLALIVGLFAAPGVMAQSTDMFREAPPPSSSRPNPAPIPEREPAIAAPQPSSSPFPHDGTWVGVHRCPEFNNR
jgi:hypothetical protein